MNNKPKWHKGAPPSIGWWPASVMKDNMAIRWWNGKTWSIAALPNHTKKEAAYLAKQKSKRICDIEWTERWWL